MTSLDIAYKLEVRKSPTRPSATFLSLSLCLHHRSLDVAKGTWCPKPLISSALLDCKALSSQTSWDPNLIGPNVSISCFFVGHQCLGNKRNEMVLGHTGPPAA